MSLEIIIQQICCYCVLIRKRTCKVIFICKNNVVSLKPYGRADNTMRSWNLQYIVFVFVFFSKFAYLARQLQVPFPPNRHCHCFEYWEFLTRIVLGPVSFMVTVGTTVAPVLYLLGLCFSILFGSSATFARSHYFTICALTLFTVCFFLIIPITLLVLTET